MKKHLKKSLAMTLAMVFVLALAACGSPASTPSSPASAVPASEPAAPETTEPQGGGDTAGWASFEGWQSEDWDAKTISYQFTGAWALEEYGMNFQLLINLYSDGSALVDQRNISSASSYTQYGYWSEEETQDGNEITFDTLYVVDLDGSLAAHEYNYQLYQESDGGYSFGYTFGIAPGSYFRTADMTGSDTAAYATLDDFHAAVDSVAEAYHFTSSTSSMEGFSAVIAVMGDNTVTADLCTEHEGAVVSAHQDAGTLKTELNEDGSGTYTLVIADTEIPLTVNADGSFADFPWTAVWENMDITVDFTMTQTEVPAAE